MRIFFILINIFLLSIFFAGGAVGNELNTENELHEDANGYENEYTITRSEWPEYVNGQTIIELPGVRPILKNFTEHEKVQIIIRHPGGEFGLNWGEQLVDWLVSFGVPISYIELQPGAGSAEQLIIALIDRRDASPN